MTAAAAANNDVGDDVGDDDVGDDDVGNDDVTWVSMADNGGVEWATTMAGSTADDGVVDGERRQRGPRVSRYEACRMEEIEMSLT